jgi:hypothetical protein
MRKSCLAFVSLSVIQYSESGTLVDCLCGLVVRVPGYRPRGPGFDSQWYHIFWGARGSVVVKALCYKPEGHGSRPDEVNDFYQFT